MAETWRDGGSSLDTLPWRVLSLSESNTNSGSSYLVKGVFCEESGYHVMLLESIASVIWEERLDAKEIQERMKVRILNETACDDPVPTYSSVCVCACWRPRVPQLCFWVCQPFFFLFLETQPKGGNATTHSTPCSIYPLDISGT